MGEDDNQALTTQCTKKGKTKKEGHFHKKPRIYQEKDYSHFICYTCNEKGNLVKDCPKKKGKKKRYHAHATKDVEPIKKRAKEDSSSDEEYFLFSTLT